MSLRYLGVFCVSLESDSSKRILAPSYLGETLDSNGTFSDAFKKYVHEVVSQEHQRMLMNFVNYDVLKVQLSSGHNPSIVYTKVNGEEAMLTIYAVPGQKDVLNTVWVFEKRVADNF